MKTFSSRSGVDEAPESSGFEGIILSDLEYGVYTFHEHLRKILPILKKSMNQAYCKAPIDDNRCN